MVFFLAVSVIAWKTRVQPTVALSTAELEFLAASDTGHFVLFIRAVRKELLQRQHAATTVYEDNDTCRISQTQQRPLDICLISLFMISRSQKGWNEIV
jgi:hypothetical protein